MDSENKKVTIKDVARIAGVSKGTVDRVVHNRGEVSDESRRRVLEVIERIGYQPNIYASMLASRRKRLIACLVPSFRPGEFWELVYNGILRSKREEGSLNIEIELFSYDQFDEDSFRETCARLLDRSPGGVIMAPMYRHSATQLTAELTMRSIPYIFIDSRLENTGYLAFFGMSMYHSGYQGGSLLLDCRDESGVLIAGVEQPGRSNNTASERRRGFLAYLEEHHPACTVYEESIRPYDTAHTVKTLDTFFAAHPEVRCTITFSSRVHLMAAYLEHRRMRDCRLVGYDMLGRNLDALRKGFCKYLITNVPEMQVYHGIRALAEYLALHKAPAVRDHFSPIDILTEYNADYYFKS